MLVINKGDLIMGSLFDVLNGKPIEVTPDIKKLSDRELLRIAKSNPYGWSIIKMAVVAQEIKNRGLD